MGPGRGRDGADRTAVAGPERLRSGGRPRKGTHIPPRPELRGRMPGTPPDDRSRPDASDWDRDGRDAASGADGHPAITVGEAYEGDPGALLDQDYLAKDIGAAERPERDVDRLADRLRSLRAGARVTLRFGTATLTAERDGTVLATKGDRESRVPGRDYEYVVEVVITVDGETRLYRTGTGADGLEPWAVLSYEYHEALNHAAADTEAHHGWLVAVGTG